MKFRENLAAFLYSDIPHSLSLSFFFFSPFFAQKFVHKVAITPDSKVNFVHAGICITQS